MSPDTKARLVRQFALRTGFDRVGVARAEPLPEASYYRDWLRAGHAGSMAYLHRNQEMRENPARLLPGARSIICVALNYYRPTEMASGKSTGAPPTGRVAQYARGRDYHAVMKHMLNRLVADLRQQIDEPFETRVCVDTAPILERQVAARAGVGWVGKNTLVLRESLGSYFFLGEIITTLDLPPDAPATDHCGTCTRCLEACPTQAFPAPYQMDASRCISYLTIEHRGEISADLRAQVGDWVYGCDVCQQVCPYNAGAPPATHPDIAADCIPAELNLLDLLEMPRSDYRRLTSGTAARRATRRMWQRNAAIAMANHPNRSERASASPREHHP